MMEGLESRLGEIMGNPDMMQKIMSLAQNLQTPEPPVQAPEPSPELPDLATIQKIAAIAGKSSIDPAQKNLLTALRPYLASHRLQKLEKAMQAAKMARMASGLFSGKNSVFGG